MLIAGGLRRKFVREIGSLQTLCVSQHCVEDGDFRVFFVTSRSWRRMHILNLITR